jgi:hypothetical protein
MANDYLLYRLIVNVKGSAEIADNASLVDEIAETLYAEVDDLVSNIANEYNIAISLDEE